MKVHHYNRALSWITRPRVTETATLETFTPELDRMNFSPRDAQQVASVSYGTHGTYGAPEQIDMPNIQDLIREEGVQVGQQVKDGGRIYDTRKYFKPGGLVEPGVTHYATTTDAEVIKFYNNQVLKKDSLYNKYKQERYTKIYDKPFEKLTTDEKRVIKKAQQNYKRLLPNLKKAEGLIKVSEASKISVSYTHLTLPTKRIV